MVVTPPSKTFLGHGPPMLVYWALSWVNTISTRTMSLLAIESDILESITNNVIVLLTILLKTLKSYFKFRKISLV